MQIINLTLKRKQIGRGAALLASLLILILMLVPAPINTQAVVNIQPELLALAVEQPETAVRVIIQKSDDETNIKETISRLGGKIVQDLHFIRAIAVELPAKAIFDLAEMPSVNWVSLDTPLMSAQMDESVSFYLQNNPFPADGDTNSQGILPLSTVPPTTGDLFNFDMDRDAFPGLLIAKGGSGYAETNPIKIQRWRLAQPDGDLQLSGEAVLTLFAAMKDFQTGKTGMIQAYLLDRDGSQTQIIANNSVTNSSWNGDWQPLTINFGLIDYTIPADHHLELALFVDGISSDNMWLAYGTENYFSNLAIGQIDLITSLRDEFNIESYDNSDGSESWTSTWIETNDNGYPNSGDIEIDNGELMIKDDDRSIHRSANLADAATAVLSFDYRRYSFDSASDYVALQISTNEGSSWAELDRFSGPASDSEMHSFSVDISEYLPNNIILKFAASSDLSNYDELYIDNLQIEFEKGTATPNTENYSTQTVRDEFSQIAWTNNDGTMNWSDPWTGYDYGGEYGGMGAYYGLVYVQNGRFIFHYAYAFEEYAIRSADLSGFTQATLSFDWQTLGLDEGETISILVSQDGQKFTQLAAYGGSQNGSANFDITKYISSSTTIRLENRSTNWESGEYAYFDNVQIEGGAYTPPPPDPEPTEPSGTFQTVRDEFSQIAWTNNDGTMNWSDPWTGYDYGGEYGGMGAYYGLVYVQNGRFIFHYAYAFEEYAIRSADLSGFTQATLSFDWQTLGLDEGETISILVSQDGQNFTQLAAYGGSQNGSANFDITEYISPSTTIRLENRSTNWESGEYAYFDNVQIEGGVSIPDPNPTPVATEPEEPEPETIRAIRDEFSSLLYNGNNGNVDWSDAWLEINENDGPGSGLARVVSDTQCVTGYCFRLGANADDDLNFSGRGLSREADLSGANSATLTFDFQRRASYGSANITLAVSNDGGANWTDLDNYALNNSDSEPIAQSYDISDFIATNTQIRFIGNGSIPEEVKTYIYIDNVQIETTEPAPVDTNEPTLNHYLSTTNVQTLWENGVQGQGVTVAVIDSGISPSLDFGDRLVAQVAFNADAQSANDSYGHGTHVAGIIGGNGAGSNGLYQGVAPGVNLIGLKVSDEQGMAYESDTVAAMQWVLENKDVYGIRVVNLSLNSTMEQSYHTSPLDLASELLWFNGVVVVASAGNRSLDGNFYTITASPANDPFIITVGASTEADTDEIDDDDIALFSAHGTTVDGFVKPDIIAPGYNIVSVLSDDSDWDVDNPDRLEDDGDYFRLSGTSMAAPMVSGAAALLLQAEPNLTPDQVKYRLMNTGSTIVPVWFDAILDKTVYPYLDVYTAASSDTLESANQNVMPHMSLAQMALIAYWASQNGAETIDWSAVDWSAVNWDNVDWEAVDWASVNWGSVNWGSVNWGSVNWGSVNWGSVNWGSVNWGSVNWGSVNWGSVNWGSVNWGSVNWGSVNWDD